MSGSQGARSGVAIGGAIIGAVIGTFLGGNTLLGAQLGFALGSIAGGMLFPGKGAKPQKGDLAVQDASYGVPIAILNGCDATAGVIFWIKGNKLERELIGGGGKGFAGGGGAGATYQYFATFGVIIGEGPIDGVRRVWFDTKLVHDRSAAALEDIIAEDGAFSTTAHIADANVIIYLGTEDQSPDPSIQADRGADNVSAMRGLAYMVFDHVPLADFANRIPNVTIEYVKDGTLSYLTRQISEDDGLGQDLYVDPYIPRFYAVSGNALVSYDATNASENLVVLDFDTGSNFGGTLDADADVNGSIFVGDRRSGFYVTRYDKVTLIKRGECAAITTNSSALGWRVRWRGEVDFEWLLMKAQATDASVVVIDAAAMLQLTPVTGTVGPITTFKDMPEVAPDRSIWIVGVPGGVATVVHAELVESAGPTEFEFSAFASHDVSAVHGSSLNHIRYYADEDVMIIAGSSLVSKFDYKDTQTIIATVDLGEDINRLNTEFFLKRGPVNGRQWVQTNSYLIEIDLATMTVVRQLLRSNWPGGQYYGYEPQTDSFAVIHFLSGDNRPFQYFLPRIDPLDVERAVVLSDYATRAGLTTGQLDLTRVTDDIQGNTIRRQTTARDASEPIMQSGFIDAAEMGGKIVYVPRGGTPVLTVPEDDLGVTLAGDDPVDRLLETLPQEINLPERVTITYRDRDNQYDNGSQPAKRARELIGSREQMTLDTAEVMSKDTALRFAERLLYSLWIEKPVKFSLGPKYRKLIPTDVINIVAHGLTFRVRITRIEDGPFLQCEGMVEDAETYVSTATGGESNIPAPELQVLSPTELFLVDSNLIRDEDDDGGYYIAVGPTVAQGVWAGAAVYKSPDGVSFIQSNSYSSAVAWGVAETALGAHHCTTTDRGNTVTIRMMNGELSSVTELEMLNGSNAFLLESDGDWEIIQAADITDLGDGRYEIATLLRGRRGTEQAADDHAVGDRFIVLSLDTMNRTNADSEIGLERFFKATTWGAVFTPSGAEAFTNTARGRECYAPTHIEGERDGSSNLTITWVRRDRLGGENDWADGVADVPMSEETEEYEVDILDSGTVVRTITGLSSEMASYSAANQTTDFGSPQSSLDVLVYQLSAVNGRGRAASATV